ncbi:MAG TPA: nucleotidyl transferase AbiEii/AbiGii toxin family protein [Anaeromyxobacteraceae bacterium]|nr:nucleotidyl transferase AbiEii/AbiGii toxin family protein [Anaeromyxobacteraceae bacterium]
MNRDFRDLFAELNAAGAEYLLVGGYALAVHGLPRFTKDLDVWVNPTPFNATRAHDALRRFGAPLADLSAADLATEGIVFQIGIPPNRIDVLTAIDGVRFAEAWPERLPTRYGDLEVPVLSRRHLVQNKRATGRPQDALDADELERG